MEFNRPPLPVTIIPASAIRADKTLLRRVGLNRNLPQPYPAYAFYTLPSAHPKRQQFASLPSEHAASVNLAAQTLPTSHIRLNTVSGPYKYPEPLYKKSTTLGHFNNRYIATATRPSHIYSTHGKYSKPTSYHAWLRYALKVIQLVLAAAILACVIIPANNEPLQSFYARTKSLGQLFVIAVTIISLVITSIFAVTVFMAKTSFTWRNVVSQFSLFYFLLIKFHFIHCCDWYGNLVCCVLSTIWQAFSRLLSFFSLDNCRLMPHFTKLIQIKYS